MLRKQWIAADSALEDQWYPLKSGLMRELQIVADGVTDDLSKAWEVELFESQGWRNRGYSNPLTNPASRRVIH